MVLYIRGLDCHEPIISPGGGTPNKPRNIYRLKGKSLEGKWAMGAFMSMGIRSIIDFGWWAPHCLSCMCRLLADLCRACSLMRNKREQTENGRATAIHIHTLCDAGLYTSRACDLLYTRLCISTRLEIGDFIGRRRESQQQSKSLVLFNYS
jgi:hypothetical protein